jgi:hypothetical protein
VKSDAFCKKEKLCEVIHNVCDLGMWVKVSREMEIPTGLLKPKP